MMPPRVRVELIRAPIDAAALAQEAGTPACGAVATFVGIVREEQGPDGRQLEFLDYSAYDAMAIGSMEQICADVLGRFEVAQIRVSHRLGRLRIGEASIAVVVSAGHRGPAFDACREIMERIKADTPIFKQEIWEGGSRSWVDSI